MKVLKIFTVYAIDPNFNLVMVGGSNDGKGIRLFEHSDHGWPYSVDLGLGNAF